MPNIPYRSPWNKLWPAQQGLVDKHVDALTNGTYGVESPFPAETSRQAMRNAVLNDNPGLVEALEEAHTAPESFLPHAPKTLGLNMCEYAGTVATCSLVKKPSIG